ncbi:MAG: MFS transporter [Oscillospiraceae bacterium]|nr:MFS transporter [Oscillospiraceae bacterium]
MGSTNFGYSQSEYKLFKNYAWRFLLLFSLLYCAHYCTRLNLSSASALMMDDLGFNKSQIGILTSTLFWTYGIGHLINGRLGELIGPGRFIALGVVLSAAANVLMSFQTKIVPMAIIWGLNGYFQSMVWSPAIAALTLWWPGNTRGFATGFANAFSGFGQAVATLMVALSFALLPTLSWRSAFLIPAALPVVMLFVYRLFTKPAPSDIGLKEYVEIDENKAAAEKEMQLIVKEKGKLFPYKYLLSNPKFLVWIFVVFASGIARYGLVTWVPLYFIERFDTDITAGLLQSLALPVGMGIGTFVVPWLTDRYCPNDRLVAAVISAVAAAVSIVVFMLLDPNIMWQLVLIEILLFIAGFFIYAINGIVWTYSADIGGRVFAGTGAGILDWAAYMGAAIQAMVYGFILDSSGWGIVFVSIAVFCLLIAIVGHISYKKDKRRLS